jgi:hypothetical protein
MNDGRQAVWLSKQPAGNGVYVALFNLSDSEESLRYPLQSLGLGKTLFAVRDLWAQRDLIRSDQLKVKLAPHTSALYLVR